MRQRTGESAVALCSRTQQKLARAPAHAALLVFQASAARLCRERSLITGDGRSRAPDVAGRSRCTGASQKRAGEESDSRPGVGAWPTGGRLEPNSRRAPEPPIPFGGSNLTAPGPAGDAADKFVLVRAARGAGAGLRGISDPISLVRAVHRHEFRSGHFFTWNFGGGFYRKL